ncbi:hypothetical protein F383_15282 [Gossypium arboreum]|uniref:Uncharacterized protein n=1 Tax=Gossypium arboreum TaxID=29729 RepID=A0A0B0PYQ9_GOSAR|nr:hypothetical protein F383_15282 [Gossypium arboreum]
MKPDVPRPLRSQS